MKTKTCPVQIKAAGTNDGTDEGVFEAIVAAYNVDSVGDRIIPGAFAETLAEWAKSGDPVPVLWAHMSHDPEYHIGYLEDARETPDGLWVRGRIDMDEPKAAKVYKLLKGRRVKQFSFSYDVLDGSPAEVEGGTVYDLRKLKLYEVGPCLIGANQATDLLGVKRDQQTVNVHVNGGSSSQALADAVKKELDRHTWTAEQRLAADVAAKADQILADKASQSADAKAGRTLSAKNEKRVKEIARLANELLDSLSSDDDSKTSSTESTTSASSTDAKATTETQPAIAEEPAGAKANAPARPGPASLRLLADLDAMCVEAI